MDITIDKEIIRGFGLTRAPITPYERSGEITEYCTVEFPDYDRIIARMNIPPLVANDIDTSTIEGQEQLKAIIYSNCEGDTIDIRPTCGCGELSGGSNINIVCPTCKTAVIHPLEAPVEASLWIRNLDKIHKFVATGFWVVFSGRFTYKDFNLLEYIVSRDVADPPVTSRLYSLVQDLNLLPEQRNLNFFYEHYREILDVIALSLVIRKKPKNVKGMTNQQVSDLLRALREKEVDVYHVILKTTIGDKLIKEKELIRFIYEMRDKPNLIFCSYLPMLSAAAMIVETNVTGSYYDPVCNHATDAMYAIINSKRTVYKDSFDYQNRKMVQCIKSMAIFSKAYTRERAMGKKKAIRAHMFGGRQPFTMRCVIGPMVGDHTSEEIILPWAPTIQALKAHITNKFRRMPRHPEYGPWTPRTISNFIDSYTNRYHELMEMVLQELLTESLHGIQILFNRPPSLQKGSIKRQSVIGICRDPRQKMIRMPTNGTGSLNADFDGDMMAVYFILDNEMIRMFEPLRPYRNIPSLSGPHQISDAAEEQGPQTITIYNYLYGAHDKYNRVDF